MGTGSELAIVRTAAASVTAVANTTAVMIQHLRTNGLVRADDRRRLANELAYLRRREVSGYLARLGVDNMNLMFELYDSAETRSHQPHIYSRALEIAAQATREMGHNLDRLARDLG